MESLVFNAIKLGHVEGIRSLMSLGANVNARNTEGYTLLHVAVIHNQPEIVKIIIDAGADVNLKNKESKTALNFAFECDDKTTKRTIIKILIHKGADVNTTFDNSSCKTALHFAAETGDVDLVQFLISRGGDVNARDRCHYDWTALHYAARNVTSENPLIFEILLSGKAEINAKSDTDQTPLHLLSKFKPAVSSTSLCKIMEVFLRFGADFYALDVDDQTPVDTAINNCNSEAVKALIICGEVDVNSIFTPSSNGRTILHEACAKKDLATVKVLLKNGADIDATNYYNQSPLQLVIDTLTFNEKEDTDEKLELLKLLFEWNPDVNLITIDGCNILTPLDDEIELPDYLWQLILKHLAQLQAVSQPIHLSLLYIISKKPEFKNYFEMCYRVLNRAKNTEPLYIC